MDIGAVVQQLIDELVIVNDLDRKEEEVRWTHSAI